jgi:hypothetical protein
MASFASSHGHGGHAKHRPMPDFLGGGSDSDFLMGGSVASCDAQVQLGFLRKVRPELADASYLAQVTRCNG